MIAVMEGRQTTRKSTNRLAGLPQWRMHESSRKLLCRALVFCCAVLPTFATLAWVVWSQTPFNAYWQAAHWQGRLEQQLGVDVRLETAVSLSPRLHRLRAMTWLHPETKSTIGTADEVWVTTYDQGCQIEIKTLDLATDELATAISWLHDQLLCRAGTVAINSRITIAKLRLNYGDVFSEFQDVQLDWKTGEQQSVVILKAKPATVESVERIHVQVVRLHDRVEPKTEWQIKSGGNPLHASLLSAVWTQAARLGINAAYVGDINAEISQRQSVWRIDGRVEQVSFDELTRALPQGLAGNGRIDSFRATVRNGQLVQASGELSIMGGGSLNRQWLVNAGRIFGLRLREELHGPGPTFVHFDQLHAIFDWDLTGLVLRGGMTSRLGENSENVVTGVVATDGNGPAFADAGVAPELFPRANSYQVLYWLTSLPNANEETPFSAVQQELALALGKHLPYPVPAPQSPASTTYQARQ
jgi:hypothetical protein